MEHARRGRLRPPTKWTYSFGVGPSVDFGALRVPIALMPEYVLVRQASAAQVRGAGTFDTLHVLALGAYYSGRTNLQLGLVAAAEFGAQAIETPLGRSDAPRRVMCQFVLRYVF